MRYLYTIFPFIAAGAAATTSSSENGAVIERDVIVIGGGSSGTYAAIRLQEEGYTTALLEKEDHLGGHTVTYTDPDTDQAFNLGVAAYQDSPIVRNYFRSLGVPVGKREAGDGDLKQGFYDFSTGHTVKGYKPFSADALEAATQKYFQLFNSRYPYLDLGYDLPDPVPEELLAPYSEFIEANDLGPIVQRVNAHGCKGNLLERPTLYGLKVFNPSRIQAADIGFIYAASGDNCDLYRAAEKRLEDVVLQAQIQRVKRSGHGVWVWAKTPNRSILFKAKKLILAIPPTLQNLEDIGLDLTQQERHLFGKFNSFFYGSMVFTHKGIKDRVLNNIGTDTPYNLSKLPGTYHINTLARGNITTDKISANFGGLDATMTENDIKQLVKGELDNLAREGTIGEGQPDFVYFTNHSPYHLHVSADDVGEGFYKKLYALEGQKSTFWTGAAFVDNDSTLLWTWTETYLLQLILDSLV